MIVPLKEVWVFSGPPSLVRILGLKTKSNIKKQIFYINFKRIFNIKRKLQTWNILATDYVKGNKIQKIGTKSLKIYFNFDCSISGDVGVDVWRILQRIVGSDRTQQVIVRKVKIRHRRWRHVRRLTSLFARQCELGRHRRRQRRRR